MRVVTDDGVSLDLGMTQTTPTIGIIDYSRRVTDDFGVTTVVERGFSRRMTVRCGVPFEQTDLLQRQLAALRTVPATWIADDRFVSLSVRGFYKDFEVDLATPPLSSCSLTIEGLAEQALPFDPGGDPAPDGQVSTLELVQPVVITTPMLASSSVPEADAPAWDSGQSYALGAQVVSTVTHRIYESLIAANLGADPTSAVEKWLDVGPTNRWAMFDQALGSATTANGSITVAIDAGTINAVAVLDAVASTVRVQAAGYDRTQAVGTGAGTFLDLPTSNGRVTVTFTGPGTVSVGTLLVGTLVTLGITEASPTVGLIDYSKKTTDDFGEVTVVPRAWAKRMSAKSLIRVEAVDLVANRLAAVRARPSLWLGQTGLDSLTVYGFFKEFEIEIDVTTAKLSLSIEGLSTAAKIDPLQVSVDWTDVGDSTGTKPENSATYGATLGTGGAFGNIKKYAGGLWYEGDLYTAIGISGGFAGQGALATLSQLAYGSPFLSGFGTLASLASLALGGNYLFQSNGTTRLSDGTIVTSMGVSAAISGQSPLATSTSYSYLTSLPTALANIFANGYLRAGYIQNSGQTGDLQTYFPATTGSDRTSNATAAAFTGQGPFATIASAAYGSSLLTGFAALATQSKINLGGGYIYRSDGSTSLTDAIAVTALGTASAIAGQSPLATSTNYGLLTSLPSVLQGLFSNGYVPAGFIQDQSQTRNIQLYFPATTGSDQTSNATAAAITSQGPWATEPTPVVSLSRPNANLVYDGGLKLRAKNWLSSGFIWALDQNPFLYTATTNSYAASPLATAIVGGIYTAQAEVATHLSDNARVYIFFFDNTGALLTNPGSPPAAPDTGFAKLTVTGTAPANAASLRVYIITNTVPANGTVLARKFKVEGGSTASVFTDDATTGALYDSGTDMNALRPLEVGANVTETRTASAIAAQGTLATRSTVSFNTTSITRADGTTIVSETLVVTSLGVSAAFSGQGALATLNAADWRNNITGQGKPADYAGSSWTAVNGDNAHTIVGNTVTRNGSGWSTTGGEVTSREAFAAAVASGQFVNAGGEIIFGLSDGTAPSGTSYTKCDFAWYRTPSNEAYVLTQTNTSPTTNLLYDAGAADPTAVYAVMIDRVNVTWTKNGVVVWQIPAPYTDGRAYTLIVTGNGAGSAATSILFGAYPDRLWGALGGVGKPANYADVTSANQAASIAGQGKGATANNLNDLDPSAASAIANAAGAQTTVRIGIGNSQVITRKVAAGATVNVSASIRATTSGNSGSLVAQLQYATTPGSWSNLGNADSEPITSTEPALSNPIVNYNNGTNAAQAVDFRVVVTAPSGAQPDPSNASFTA